MPEKISPVTIEGSEEPVEKGKERLMQFLNDYAGQLQRWGCRVDNGCRLVPELTPEDRKRLENVKRKINFPRNEIKQLLAYRKDPERILLSIKEKSEEWGEWLERLKVAVFAKFLGKDWIVVRTSEYDDFFNKVDNIILNPQGEIVCAIDEVSEVGGISYRKKTRVVSEINTKGGAKLKYGISLEVSEKGRRIEIKECSNIPIFFLPLPMEEVENTIRVFSIDWDSFSKQEVIVLLRWYIFLLQQTECFLHQSLDEKIKDRLLIFRKLLLDASNKELRLTTKGKIDFKKNVKGRLSLSPHHFVSLASLLSFFFEREEITEKLAAMLRDPKLKEELKEALQIFPYSFQELAEYITDPECKKKLRALIKSSP